jgi:hypothetical protein
MSSMRRFGYDSRQRRVPPTVALPGLPLPGCDRLHDGDPGRSLDDERQCRPTRPALLHPEQSRDFSLAAEGQPGGRPVLSPHECEHAQPVAPAPALDDQQSYRQVPSPLPLLEGERDDGAGGAGPIPTDCWPPSSLHWVQGVRSTRPWEESGPAGPLQQALGPKGTDSRRSARSAESPRDRARVADPGTGRAWPTS